METVRYSITEQNHVAFSALHFRASNPKGLFWGGVIVVVMAGLGYIADGYHAAIAIAVGGILGVGIMLGLARFITVPRQSKRAWRDFALIREPIELTCNDEGFSMVQPSASVQALWENMIAWNEDEHVFAIYITQQQAYILPKEQVGPKLVDYARERLIESGLIAKGKKRT